MDVDGSQYPNGGNVGIGETSPDSLLHIKASAPDFRLEGSPGSADGDVANILAYHGTDNIGKIRFKRGADAADGEIEFFTANDSLNSAAMHIDQNSNVGIGHTVPVAKLHVSRSADSTEPIAIFEHAEAALDADDRILVLKFTNESTVRATHDWVQFVNADGQVGTINSEVAYDTFTGAHTSQRPSGSSYSSWKEGMVVKSTGNIVATGSTMSLAWPEVDLTTSQKDKAVIGVFAETGSAGHEMAHLDRTLPIIHYNAVGEGRMRVTDTNGNIDVGDYICSSARTGHGEKQDEVYLANFTIAKATQPYNFISASNDADLGYKSVLIACTYHCG